MGDEFKDADVDRSIKALSTLFGFDGSKTGLTHSVVMETTSIVCGAPPYPKIPNLDLPWWRILERRRRIAERERLVCEWQDAYKAWVADADA